MVGSAGRHERAVLRYEHIQEVQVLPGTRGAVSPSDVSTGTPGAISARRAGRAPTRRPAAAVSGIHRPTTVAGSAGATPPFPNGTATAARPHASFPRFTTRNPSENSSPASTVTAGSTWIAPSNVAGHADQHRRQQRLGGRVVGHPGRIVEGDRHAIPTRRRRERDRHVE